MADIVNLKDKSGNIIYPSTDWSGIHNKPGNLATTDQLGALGPWKNDGISYQNGGYDWDHQNNGMNCAYRIANFGSFKIVETRLIVGCSQKITTETQLLTMPESIRQDSNIEHWILSPYNAIVRFDGTRLTITPASSTGVEANTMLSFTDIYLTTR